MCNTFRCYLYPIKMFIALIYLIQKETNTMMVPDIRTSPSTLDNREGTLLFLAQMQQLHQSDTEHKTNFNLSQPLNYFSVFTVRETMREVVMLL